MRFVNLPPAMLESYSDAATGIINIAKAMTPFYMFGIFMSLISVVCLWFTFLKAGKGGWEAIIPIYNLWMISELGTGKGYYILAMLVPIVGQIVMLYILFRFFKAYSISDGFAALLVIFPVIGFAITGFSATARYKGYWRGI